MIGIWYIRYFFFTFCPAIIWTWETSLEDWKMLIRWCRTDICSCKRSAKASLMLENPLLVLSLCKLNYISVCFIQISTKTACKQLVPSRESQSFFEKIPGVFDRSVNFKWHRDFCEDNLRFRFLWLCSNQSVFSTSLKSQDEDLNILRTKRALKMKIKTFFHHFGRAIIKAKSFFGRWESDFNAIDLHYRHIITFNIQYLLY